MRSLAAQLVIRDQLRVGVCLLPDIRVVGAVLLDRASCSREHNAHLIRSAWERADVWVTQVERGACRQRYAFEVNPFPSLVAHWIIVTSGGCRSLSEGSYPDRCPVVCLVERRRVEPAIWELFSINSECFHSAFVIQWFRLRGDVQLHLCAQSNAEEAFPFNRKLM